MGKWFENSYRRNLVDMHIEDWDDSFLSKFDPAQYVEFLKKSRVKSAEVYANSHLGHCYWPTRTGHMHNGLKGRDIFGEVLERCHSEGIDFVTYYSLIYNNWAYEQNPSWRIMDGEGKASRERFEPPTFTNGRYGVCCPNSGYREFAVRQIEELCSNYKFEGMFFDMTFWPKPCYCKSCKARFKKETGNDIPVIVDWNDPIWLEYQRKREEWMSEFAVLATNTVKMILPECTVNHNTSPQMLFSWYFAPSIGVMNACDYLGGDVYSDFLHQSFISKFYYNTSRNLPYEFYTSRCEPNLNLDHTAMKPKELLMVNNYLSLAHKGAFVFIDAIDPVGTLNPDVYETMGEIFGESQKYEPYIGGEMMSDVAVYYSVNSKMDIHEKLKNPSNPWIASKNMPHMNAALGGCRILKDNHVPFTVIGINNIKDLSKYQILVLPEVLVFSEEEADTVREYVKSGGSLYASGHLPSSLLDDIFGIERMGETTENVTYMAPTERGANLMAGISRQHPLTVNTRQLTVKAFDKDSVMATVTLPYTNPEDYSKFVSIHSNPPGKETSYPSLIFRNYGKGKVIWSAASFEAIDRKPHEKLFMNIIRELATRPFGFKADFPPCIEMVLYNQPDKNRYVVHFINEQEKLPPLKATGLKTRVRTDKVDVTEVSVLPGGKKLEFRTTGKYTEFILPELYIFEMVEVKYRLKNC